MPALDSMIPSILMRANFSARSGGRDAANRSRSATTCSRNRFLVSTALTTTKSHGWVRPTLGAAWAAERIRCRVSAGMGSPVNSPRTSRRRMIVA